MFFSDKSKIKSITHCEITTLYLITFLSATMKYDIYLDLQFIINLHSELQSIVSIISFTSIHVSCETTVNLLVELYSCAIQLLLLQSVHIDIVFIIVARVRHPI